MSIPVDGSNRRVTNPAVPTTTTNSTATTNPALEKARNEFNQYQYHSTRDVFSYQGATGGKLPTVDMSGAKTILSGQANWGNNVYTAQGAWGTPGSNFYAAGQAKFLGYDASAKGAVQFDPKHLTFGANGSVDASAYLVNAQGQLHANYGWGSTDATGYATVGADAHADGNVAFDPLHGTAVANLNADAFAGVRAGGEVKQTVGPVGIDAGAKVEAGIGADFSAHAGFDHGKFSASLDIGACLGIGADFKIGFSIDTAKLASEVEHLGEDALKDVGKVAAGAVHTLENVGEGVVHGVEDVAKGVEHAASSVVSGVEHAASSVGHAVGSAVSSVGHAIGSIFHGW